MKTILFFFSFLVVNFAYAHEKQTPFFIYAFVVGGDGPEVLINPLEEWVNNERLSDGYSKTEKDFILPVIDEAGLCNLGTSTYTPCKKDSLQKSLAVLNKYNVFNLKSFQEWADNGGLPLEDGNKIICEKERVSFALRMKKLKNTVTKSFETIEFRIQREGIKIEGKTKAIVSENPATNSLNITLLTEEDEKTLKSGLEVMGSMGFGFIQLNKKERSANFSISLGLFKGKMVEQANMECHYLSL